MEKAQPLTPAIWADLAEHPGQCRVTGRIIGGQLFIIFREGWKK